MNGTGTVDAIPVPWGYISGESQSILTVEIGIV